MRVWSVLTGNIKLMLLYLHNFSLQSAESQARGFFRLGQSTWEFRGLFSLGDQGGIRLILRFNSSILLLGRCD